VTHRVWTYKHDVGAQGARVRGTESARTWQVNEGIHGTVVHGVGTVLFSSNVSLSVSALFVVFSRCFIYIYFFKFKSVY